MKRAILNTRILGVIFLIFSIFSLFLYTKIDSFSVAADKPEALTDVNLRKYVNYDEQWGKGTLLQYKVNSRIKYEEGQEKSIIKSSELSILSPQINGVYPETVTVINKSSQLQTDYTYDATSGRIIVYLNNEDENGNPKTNDYFEGTNNELEIITNYGEAAYNVENQEKELILKVASKQNLFNEENNMVESNHEYKLNVSENIGNVVSIEQNNDDIYNGYIKSNIINGTNYNTSYKEYDEIQIGNKHAQDNIDIIERTVGSTYKNTEIKKEDLINVLGEDGVIEIFDVDGNKLATLDKEKTTATYETLPEQIIIKTSNIVNEGIIRIQNIKELQNPNNLIENLKVTSQIIGKKSEQITYTKNEERSIEIKDSETKIDVSLDKEEWTNEKQNEVTFDVALNNNNVQYNLYKNPTIKIELPSEVEKVILGESSIIYGDGLELQNVELEENENGKAIAISINGQNTKYNENNLGLKTTIKIPATIILKQEIETGKNNLNVKFTNEYTIDGVVESGSYAQKINIINFREVTNKVIQSENENLFASQLGAKQEDTVNDSLKLEVVPTKGETVLNDGDIVYEGEFIKYNIKVTNTSDEDINNVKVVATIPEGVTYGELEAEYFKSKGKYEYIFDENIREKTIEIGTVKAGESENIYFEVKANDLGEEENKQIETNIRLTKEEADCQNYNILNKIYPANYQIFMGAILDLEKDGWNYDIKILGEENKDVNVEFNLPEDFDVLYIFDLEKKEIIYSFDENKLFENPIVLQTNHEYYLRGIFNTNAILEKTENNESNKIWMNAVAQIVDGDTRYSSNETRILYSYDKAIVSINSETEGENIKYDDEIIYEIKVSNVGKTNSDNTIFDSLSLNISDFLPENVVPVSLSYIPWIEEKTNESENAYIPTGKYYQGEMIEQEIGYTITDSDGEIQPNVNLDVIVPYEENVVIKVKTKAGFVTEKTKIENKATISGLMIKPQISNSVVHYVLPYNYQERPDDETINPDNPDKQDDSDNQEDNKKDNQNDTTSNDYSVSGVAWLDENEDGQRQLNEKLLNDITVMMVDLGNNQAIKSRTKTDSNGEYSFSNIQIGNYIIVFQYDTNNYKITEYKKSRVSDSINSDAVEDTITINGQNKKVGLTETINLNSNIKNIDIGLVKVKNGQLKIEKYISKVTTITNRGTKEKSYDNAKLVKTEIRAKEIENAQVIVDYKIVVTNENDYTITAGQIIDYIPDGFKFFKNGLSNWSENIDGTMTNSSLVSKDIAPGETKEIHLQLTKDLTENNTGTYTNTAKIAGNNESSSADIIISISTGIVRNIIIIVTIITILVILIFLLYKYGGLHLAKLGILLLIFSTTVFSVGVPEVFANSTRFRPWRTYG